jgi:hypothetical protein
MFFLFQFVAYCIVMRRANERMDGVRNRRRDMNCKNATGASGESKESRERLKNRIQRKMKSTNAAPIRPIYLA